MCEEFNEAMAKANSNLYKLGDSINRLNVPCNYKGAFLLMADNRGFRFTNDTLEHMETIGQTKSEVLIHLLDGKSAGLIVPYILATYLETDKARAMVLQLLEEEKRKTTESNVLKAILTVKNRD